MTPHTLHYLGDPRLAFRLVVFRFGGPCLLTRHSVCLLEANYEGQPMFNAADELASSLGYAIPAGPRICVCRRREDGSVAHEAQKGRGRPQMARKSPTRRKPPSDLDPALFERIEAEFMKLRELQERVALALEGVLRAKDIPPVNPGERGKPRDKSRAGRQVVARPSRQKTKR